MIKFSFKKGGINIKMNGTEDNCFDWPKNPNMVIVEKLPEYNMELDMNSKNLIKGNDSNSDDDILFNY